MQRFVHCHVNAASCKIRRARQRRGAGAYHSHSLSDFDNLRFLVVSVCNRLVCNVSFEIAYCDASTQLVLAYAMLFALILLRTNSSANCRKIVVVFQHAICDLNITLLHVCDKIGDMHAHGATAHTRRVFAIEASVCLVFCKFCGISERNLVEVAYPFVCGLSRHMASWLYHISLLKLQR